MLQNFRTYQLAVKFFHQTKNIPLKGELKDQLYRSSLSIVLNLAEGSGKFHYPVEQKRFYRISFGSLRECQAILDITGNVDSEIIALADKLGGHLHKLTI